jgi:hypothetical protein
LSLDSKLINLGEIKMRTVTEIQQDYSQLCTRAGHLQYSLFALNLDLSVVNEQLKDLNIEGAAAQKEAASLKAVPDAPVVS